MSKSLIFFLLCFAASMSASTGEAKALERLTITTDVLITSGESMTGDAMSGMLVLEDTLSVDLLVDPEYSYQFIIWTDSAFNYIDFWLTTPNGDSPSSDLGDHTSLVVMPDTTEAGVWQLEMELLEGAYSDTAYYAVAIFTRPRSLR
ncbi:MAG: hypothetical protein U9P42_01050 [Candidatus Fermentibacteria bacterium]|nr:hypothetical protein [Candidatus Fermentibacteria bacterium]